MENTSLGKDERCPAITRCSKAAWSESNPHGALARKESQILFLTIKPSHEDCAWRNRRRGDALSLPQGDSAEGPGPCGGAGGGCMSFLRAQPGADVPPEHPKLCPGSFCSITARVGV